MSSKSKNIIILFLLILIILLISLILVYFFFLKEGKVCRENVSFEIKRIIEEKETYRVDVKYPYFTSGFDSLVRDSINNKIQELIDYNTKEIKLYSSSQLADEQYKSILEIDHKFFGRRGDFLSTSLNVYTFGSGSVHGLSHLETLNFNIENGEEVLLNQLFRSDTGYLEKISQLIRSELELIRGDELDDWALRGTEPLEENFDQFYINGDLITFIFDAYEIAAYAMGRITVDIPLSELKDYLNEGFNLN